MNQGNRTATLAYYGAQLALCCLALALVPPLRSFPLAVPVTYDGDGMMFTILGKIVHEDGFLHARRIGAPFGSDIVDWPIGMKLPFGIMAALVGLTGEAGSAINLYWLGTILFSAAAATWALRRLRVPPGLAFVLGILYAFQPSTFYRNVSHIALAFPLVPLLLLLCLRVAGARPEDDTRGERVVTLLAAAAQGLHYIYFTFFTCMLLVVAVPIGWLRTGDRRLALRAVAAIALAVAATAYSVGPSVLYWQRHGTNPDLEYKSPAETDLYGLKLRHLLVPIGDHPVAALRWVAERVAAARFPGENENAYAKLGLLGSLGLLALLGFALGRAAGLLPGRDDDLDAAAGLTLAVLLVATVGGFASLFSVFVAPDIRAYNRIVVFISFLALLAFGTLAARVASGWPRLAGVGPEVRYAALGALLLGGLLDEVPVYHLGRLRAGRDSQFAEDRAFTRAIEACLPPGAMVFQLPHMTIPVDRNTRPPMNYYDPARAFLHSRSLRWSWGSVIGRTRDWQSGVGALPPDELLPVLATAGFSGLWIDRYGYTGEHTPPYGEIERQVARLTGERPLVSLYQRYSFFRLDRYRERLEQELGPERLRIRRRELLADMPVLRWREGCSDERPAGESWSRACGHRSFVVLKNPRTSELEVTLEGRLRPLAGAGVVRLNGPGLDDAVDLAHGEAPYRRVLRLRGQARLRVDLEFEGAASCGEAAGATPCFEFAPLRATTRRMRRGVPSTADEVMPGT